MKEYQSLSHTRWDCKYHVVFIPGGAPDLDVLISNQLNINQLMS